MLKSARHYYYPLFPWIFDKLSWKKSVLVRYKILGLFVNTLTAEYMYSGRNMQTLSNKFRRHYLENKRFFLNFLFPFWNLHDMENIFQKRESLLA